MANGVIALGKSPIFLSRHQHSPMRSDSHRGLYIVAVTTTTTTVVIVANYVVIL